MRPLLLGLSAAVWTAALAATEGAIAAPPGHRAAMVAACAGCGAALGLAFAGAEIASLALVRRAPGTGAVAAWWTRHTSADPGAPREPVVSFLSSMAGAVVGFVAFVAAFAIASPRLASVEEASLRSQLTVALAATTALAGAALGLLAVLGLRPVVRRVDRWRPLPWPRGRRARIVAWLLVPALLVVGPLVFLLPGPLRSLAPIAAFALVIVLQIAVAPWLARLPTGRRAGAAVAVAGVALLAVATGLAHRGLATAAVADRLAAAPVARLGASMLRGVTDADRDGSSSLFGGGDCAALDGARHPLARDVAGNGVDEDCSGADATPGGAGGDLSTTPPAALAAATIEPARRNLVWIVVDAVRADATSLLGHRRPTTPFLESLAGESLVFERAFSQSSATMLSIPSMLTGRDPATITWRHDGERLQLTPEHRTLPERVAAHGYRSAIVVDGYIAGKLSGMTQGFDDTLSIWLDGKRDPWQDRSSMVAVTRAIDWLERDDALGTRRAKPFVLVVYMHNPHAPYDARPEYGADYGKKARDRYDAEITFADRATGFLVDYLRYRRVWNDTVLVHTSDHGEEFGEHGGKNHASQCHRESTHVPLLVRIPGVKPARVATPVALVDVVPTLLDVVGEDDRAELDGQSLLVPAFHPTARPVDRPIFCSVISQKEAQGQFLRRSVRVDERAYFHDRVSGNAQLYDTAADPEEKTDLAESSAEAPRRAALDALLRESMRGNLGEMPLQR